MRKTKTIRKGEYGYFSWEKKRRAAVTLAMFLLPALLFVTGYIQTGGRKNLFTFVAILGCLPACKSLVGWLMMMPRKSMSRDSYEEIQKRAGALLMAYDLYFTTYEKNALVDALAIRGGMVAGLCGKKQEHRTFMEKHIRDMLSSNGFPATVQLFEEPQAFVKKLDAMQRHAAGDSQAEQEEKIRRIILAIAL
ncbi:MAG: hypothetical protein HFH60_05085 [Lachnospiraceae bacterium]|nr:hypothetical protein [Lachnospiraceae bacterium]